MVVNASWVARAVGLIGLCFLLMQSWPAAPPAPSTATPELLKQVEIQGQGVLPAGARVTLHFPEVAVDRTLESNQLHWQTQGGWRARLQVPAGAVNVAMSVSAPGMQPYHGPPQPLQTTLPPCSLIAERPARPHLQPTTLRPRPKPQGSPIPIRGAGPGQEIR